MDPGTYDSAYVVYDPDMVEVVRFGFIDNSALLGAMPQLWESYGSVLAIEGMVNQGNIVGKETFDTLMWMGRFIQRWTDIAPGNKCSLVPRNRIKVCMTGKASSKDNEVHAGAKARFEPTGGGSDPYKGTKKKRGPLFGMKSHMFSALAVCLTWAELIADGHVFGEPLRRPTDEEFAAKLEAKRVNRKRKKEKREKEVREFNERHGCTPPGQSKQDLIF